jgi:hypothetical protein
LNKRIPSRFPIIDVIKLGAPDFDDVHKTLQ